MNKEEMIRKYVKDLDGLLKEVGQWGKPEIIAPYHGMVIFLFGLLFRFFKFDAMPEFSPKKLPVDARGVFNEKLIYIEFEVFSSEFEGHGHDKEVCDLIVCWEDNWKNPPSKIDIIELKAFWEMSS